jgi:hypothetical protein
MEKCYTVAGKRKTKVFFLNFMYKKKHRKLNFEVWLLVLVAFLLKHKYALFSTETTLRYPEMQSSYLQYGYG